MANTPRYATSGAVYQSGAGRNKDIRACKLSIDNLQNSMIAGFRHKGLRRFFESGDRRGINAEHADRILSILTTLEAARDVEAVGLPSYRLHALAGDLKGYWSVTVRANWRIIFRFDAGSAIDVDLVDYH